MGQQNVWLITGTSTGLGKELAEVAIARSDFVAATVRKAGANRDLVARAPERVKEILLDVTRPEQIAAAVADATAAFGRIDILVNNAGYGLFGGAEEVTDEQLRRQIETNLIGSIEATRAVLPLMRAQRSGHIIQIASMGGQITYPGLSLYHATKWGVEGFCEALTTEVTPLGIQVTIVEPGGIRTNWSGPSMVFATPIDAYAQTPLEQMRQHIGNAISLGDPLKMAEAIASIAGQPSAPLRLALGSDAYQNIRTALQARLAALDAQEEIAKSTDVVEVTR